MNFHELLKISADEMEKIFPKDYYAKYEAHLRILEFEKLVIDEEIKKRNMINFQSRRNQAKNKKIQNVGKRVQINKHDSYEETIEKNKEQLKRLAMYASVLDKKLDMRPVKKENTIKSPMKADKEIRQELLLNLKAAEDLEYETQIKKRERAKKLMEHKNYCKFVSKSTAASPRKYDLDTDPQKIQAPNQSAGPNEAHLQKNGNFLASNTKLQKSKSSFQKYTGLTSNQQSKVSKVSSHRKLTRNRKTVKYGNWQNAAWNNDSEEGKRDLIEETKKIRNQVQSMKVMKRYREEPLEILIKSQRTIRLI